MSSIRSGRTCDQALVAWLSSAGSIVAQDLVHTDLSDPMELSTSC